MRGLRRFRLVTVPVTVMAFGLIALLARTNNDRPEKLVGLPGTGRLVPDHGVEATTTTVAAPATSTPTSFVAPDVEPVRRASVGERPWPTPTVRREPGGTTTATTVATTSDGGVPPTAALPSPSPSSGEPTEKGATGPRTVSVPATTTGMETTTSTTAPPLGPTTTASTTSTTAPADAVFEHTYSSDHEGPVWIRVEAPDDAVRTILIRWGPYQRLIVHETRWPTTYAFHKDAGPTVPTTVTVSRGAGVRVTFGQGLLAPLGSVDVNDGWTAASEPDG